MQKLTNEQRVEIYRRWKEDGTSQAELAKQFRVSAATVNLIIKKMNSVPKMLDALNAADDKPVIEDAPEANQIEQVTQPVVMTEEHTAAPPDVVRKAVLYRIADIDDECNAAEVKIKALREKIHELTKERGELEIWVEEVRNDSTEN
ncbi:MAG: helix-turn-helix domain-containing protein [Oscillospiraceae bacterium]|nr:helix-turn-helix domain-containing protein [Oscillospiraceae bacterium]